jgi:alcohol dehydrogenase class IV
VLDWVLALRNEIGIPHTLAELGVKEADLDTLVPEAVDDPSTGGNPRAAGAAEMRAADSPLRSTLSTSYKQSIVPC